MKFTSLADAARGLTRLTGPGLVVGLTSCVRRVSADYLVTNVALSPVGRFQRMVVPGPGGKRISLPRDRHPGKARASWRLAVGQPAYAKLRNATQYPIPGAAQAWAALRAYKLGQTVYQSNDARSDGAKRGYADVILLVGRHVDRLGRMIGSLQAPRGTVLPSHEQVSARVPGHLLAGLNDGLAELKGARGVV